MENKVEKYIIVEILEKVYRLKKFIGTQKPLLKNNGNAVTIEVFERAFEKIIESLKYPISVLNINNIDNEVRFSLNRRLSTIFHLVTQFHGKLKYIYSEWVRPETYTFTKRLMKDMPVQDSSLRLNIILSDEYTFKENNLINKFNEILRSTKLSKISDEIGYPTFFLPKIEFTNPLNWAILAHEMAHINENEISTFIDEKELIPPGTSNEHSDVLKRWAEEIYCDIFAINILGPAYFASFVSFALATTGLGGNCSNSYSHPSNMLRIRILHEHLTRNGVNIPIDNKYLNVTGINEFYHTMIEDFDRVDRKLLGTSLPNGLLIDDLTHFVDFIRDKSKGIVAGLKIEDEELSVIGSLKNRLKRGITIGSYRNTNDQLILEKLNNSESDFDEIKSMVSENSTSIREILNAGWINKVENTFPTVVDYLFGDSPIDIKSCLIMIGNIVEESDDRLLKSIETSELFYLLENK